VEENQNSAMNTTLRHGRLGDYIVVAASDGNRALHSYVSYIAFEEDGIT
jgi:hypothetical protein